MSILSYCCRLFIDLGSKSSNPFPYLTFLDFTLMIFPIPVIQRSIPLRDLLCSWFFLCPWKYLIIVIWVSGQPLSPPLSLLSGYWISVSMDLANFSLLWLELILSPLSGFLMEVHLNSDGLCTIQFSRDFTPVSLLHEFHAVSFQVLIFASLYSGLMFFFGQVGFYL